MVVEREAVSVAEDMLVSLFDVDTELESDDIRETLDVPEMEDEVVALKVLELLGDLDMLTAALDVTESVAALEDLVVVRV